MHETFTNLAIAFGGVMAVSVLWLFISSWIRAVVERRSAHPSRPWTSAAAASLLHAGPWAILIAIGFGVYIHTAPWAAWFFGGAAVWALFVALLVTVTVRRIKNSRRSNAA